MLDYTHPPMSNHRRTFGFHTLYLLLTMLAFSMSLAAQEAIDSVEVLYEQSPFYFPQPSLSAATPNLNYRIHNNNKFLSAIMNNGMIGNPFNFRDVRPDRPAPSFFHQQYNYKTYANLSALWIGGVVGTDTLVSTAYDESGEMELLPDFAPLGNFVNLSNTGETGIGTATTKEQIYQATYADTFRSPSVVPYNTYDHRYHRPLGIEVVQTSYSWPYKYSEDFIIVDYVITNVGNNNIRDAFVGIYLDGAVYRLAGADMAPTLDDNEGFISQWKYPEDQLGQELVQIGYVMDNNGEPRGAGWALNNQRNALGISALKTPRNSTANFNWWTAAYNWGPRRAGTSTDPYRPFLGGKGIPYGDKNKYYLMSHPEVDYSGWEAAVNYSSRGWLPPHTRGSSIASGHKSYFVMSWGPFNLPPNASERLTVVYVFGENVHSTPNAYADLFRTSNPGPFMAQIKFQDLIDNYRWAKKIFDNPGVDTDGDGDSGRSYYNIDPATGLWGKVFYTGDGVPDFAGASSPPAPNVRVRAEEGRITVRWNGKDVENYFDNFSRVKDFEGYRVRIGRSPNDFDFSTIASYDIENYNRYKYNPGTRTYDLRELPFTADSLRAIYQVDFDPNDYSDPSTPFVHDSTIWIFKPSEYNAFNLSDTTLIHKVYPDALLDTTDVDAEGRMRYYEYEMHITNLFPSVPYWVAVTAFDFGDPANQLASLETSPLDNMVNVWAREQGDSAVLKDGKLNVYTYPNPYRADGNYKAMGFENRLTDLADERARSIWFANLPNKCSISIFSLDGDLIRKLEHDEPIGSGASSIHRWDLISKNFGGVVSGMYYWVIESSYGNQIGKLVIIM
jgi:hypothetical protein